MQMSYFRGLTTLSSTGLRTITVGFQPIGYRITYSMKFGGDTIDHVSVGGSDGTRQHVVGHYADSTGRQTYIDSAKVVSHKERSGGVLVEVVSATHSAMTATGPQVNVTIANTSYQALVEAWD